MVIMYIVCILYDKSFMVYMAHGNVVQVTRQYVMHACFCIDYSQAFIFEHKTGKCFRYFFLVHIIGIYMYPVNCNDVQVT